MERLGYRPSLDGLRAVAVLSVVLVHCWPTLLPGGYLGVSIFFTLSGFLITTLLLEEADHWGTVSLAHFYGRRALRLLPALVLMLASVSIYATTVAPAGVGRASLHGVLWSLTYVANWTTADVGVVAHTWSLAVEEQFYLLWPVILVLLWRCQRVLSGTAVLGGLFIGLRLALIARGTDAETVYHTVHGDELLIGCLLAAVRRRGSLTSLRKSTRVRLGVLGAAILAAVAWMPVTNEIQAAEAGALLAALAAALVIIAAADLRLLELHLLVEIGRASYGIYLWHYPVAAALRAAGIGYGPLLLLAAAPAAVVIASASHRWVEQPCLRWKNRLGRTPQMLGAA